MLFGTYYRFIKYIIDDMAWLRRILGICKKTQNKTVEGNQVTVKHRQVRGSVGNMWGQHVSYQEDLQNWFVVVKGKVSTPKYAGSQTFTCFIGLWTSHGLFHITFIPKICRCKEADL